METRSPSIARIVTMVLFALSCVGLLLFLWLSFGGTMPFNPQGYRIKAEFKYADQLAGQSDVRIAGVSVGRVVSTQLAPDRHHTLAVIQINKKYAPIPRDTRAILRTKTILGETYVELSPGSRRAGFLRDGGMLPLGQVQPAVQLDQIFNAFDPRTRRAFQEWQTELAAALKGNDQNLNAVLGNLPTFAANAADVVAVLDLQHAAVVNLLRNGGTVFAALNRDPAALQSLIRTGETTFATTAAQNRALAATFHVFPTFLNESKATMADLQRFALNTNPLISQLLPVAHDLGPTLHSVRVLSPYLRHLFTNLGPLISVSQTGLPAVRDVLHGATPLLTQLGAFLDQLNPIFGWFSIHQQLISDFLTAGAAALQDTTTTFGLNGSGHYLRQFSPSGADTLSLAPNRSASNRGNTYPPPTWLTGPEDFQHGNFPAWDCRNTGASGDGSVGAAPGPAGHPSCWVAPSAPGLPPSTFPHVVAGITATWPTRSK